MADKCHAPRDASENQALPDDLKNPDAPNTARQVACFASLKQNPTMRDVVKKCGAPDQHAGSGVYIFVYYMEDCSTVIVNTPDLKSLNISHVNRKQTTVLFNNWR